MLVNNILHHLAMTKVISVLQLPSSNILQRPPVSLGRVHARRPSATAFILFFGSGTCRSKSYSLQEHSHCAAVFTFPSNSDRDRVMCTLPDSNDWRQRNGKTRHGTEASVASWPPCPRRFARAWPPAAWARRTTRRHRNDAKSAPVRRMWRYDAHPAR